MPIQTFLAQLRSGPIGKIYWANLAMQLSIGLLDRDLCKKVLSTAATEPVYLAQSAAAALTGRGERDVLAVQALNRTAKFNEVAILACPAIDVATALPDRCSNVISGKTFVDYCLAKDGRTALAAIAVQLAAMTPSTSVDIEPLDIFSSLAAAGFDTVDKIRLRFSGVPDFLAPTLTLKTKFDRFWLGPDPVLNPGTATEIRNRLALGFMDDEFLIRLSFNRADLVPVLSGVPTVSPRRPSALCVNDIAFPRFRGHRAVETVDSTTHLPKGQTLALVAGAAPKDGLDEWICPMVTLDSSKVVVEFLGAIKGAAMEPDNAEFVDYLDTHRAFTAANDDALIALLA